MKLKVNWRTFFIVFAILEIAQGMSGCTPAWIGTVSAMLPGILGVVNAAVSFVAALQGKTVPAGLLAKFQQWQQNISALIAQAQQFIADFNAKASSGILAQLQAVMQDIVTNLNSILTDLGITDSSTLSKITDLVKLAVSAAEGILALLPLGITKMQEFEAGKVSKKDLHRADSLAAAAGTESLKALQQQYGQITNEATANPDVNAALAQLPKL
jgi:hypothetical protein